MNQIDTSENVLDNLSIAVLLFDKDLYARYVNASAEMLFNRSAKHLVGAHLEQVVILTKPITHRIEEALSSGHPFSEHDQSLYIDNGREIPVELSVSVLQSGDGEPQVLLEISSQNRLKRLTLDAAKNAQQTATRELLRGLAHEIKNPLGGLRGAAQLLEKELDDDELKEYTSVIIDEADRLQKLVNRLLGPSGMPKNSFLNIHDVLEYVVNILKAEGHPGVVISRDYDPSIPEIKGDKDLLIQAILNIVRNAREAIGDKGEIRIKTRVLRMFTIAQNCHKLVIKIDITDSGPGISKSLIDKIFFPMITGRAEGTGLGLSISQRLISQHKGIIECESEPGATTFSILLPVNTTAEETE